MSKLLEWTLLYVIDKENDKILLGEKQRSVCKGFWNGIGGKKNPGETIEEAMIRECQEEANITPKQYEKREKTFGNMHVYIAFDYEGIVKDSDELKLQWVKREDLKYKAFTPGDELWLPDLLQGYMVDAFLKFNKNNVLVENKIYK